MLRDRGCAGIDRRCGGCSETKSRSVEKGERRRHDSNIGLDMPPTERPASLPPLVNLQEGATLLPDPEKPLRTKAAELAASENDRMAAAYISAGCWTPASKDEQEE